MPEFAIISLTWGVQSFAMGSHLQVWLEKQHPGTKFRPFLSKILRRFHVSSCIFSSLFPRSLFRTFSVAAREHGNDGCFHHLEFLSYTSIQTGSKWRTRDTFVCLFVLPEKIANLSLCLKETYFYVTEVHVWNIMYNILTADILTHDKIYSLSALCSYNLY